MKTDQVPVPSSERTEQVDGPTNQFDANQFTANLRQALEHVNDEDWLKDHSPLETALAFLPVGTPAAQPQLNMPSAGVRSLDESLKVIWQDWQSRPKSALQQLLWSAVLQAPPGKDVNHAALLLLTYFQYPRPRQSDLIKALAIGQSTFYRQLNAAIQALEQALIAHLRPSLRLEWPALKPLVGRGELKDALMAALREGGFVNLVGASGLGKTSLGAAIAHAWPATTIAFAIPPSTVSRPPTFWYTFRPGLTDNVQQLIYAIALFLHQQGVSNLWMHLLTKPEDLGPIKTMAMIRKGLEDVARSGLPLFCFDDVDVLLPSDLEDNEQHAQLRAWLEDFVKLGAVPVLFIGQRLVLEPDQGRTFTLGRFGAAEVSELLREAGIGVDEAVQDAVLAYTHGNPLLVQLLVTLHRIGEPIITNLTHLATAANLDWFLARLRRHLTVKEQDLLDAICVFDAPAPADIWRRHVKTLNRLDQLHLIDRSPSDHIVIPMALREGLYRQLPADVRAGLHVSAAQACAGRGAFTLAAHHFVLGQQPEMALWVWYDHREQEIRQGQAQTALQMFEPLRFASLADEKDRRALSLLMAELYHLQGKHEDGLTVLDAVSWQPGRVSTSRARELRGKLLAMRGDVDAALAEYRASLDTLGNLSPAKPITVRAELAQQVFWRARDLADARREALLAKLDMEILLGDIEAETGRVDLALEHYQAAMDLARQNNDPVRLAKVNEVMGILEARRLNVEVARRHLDEASRHYSAYGNLICAVGVTNTNMAYAYLLARRYHEAIAPAEEAIAFFKDVNQPYWLSLNEANMAEALANLEDLQPAEEWAWRALAHEETAVRPYCLYVLGHIRRLQGQFDAAERFCKDALASANINGDLWAAGPAWRVLGETYRDWSRPREARAAFDQAIQLYTQLGVSEEVAWLSDLIHALDAVE